MEEPANLMRHFIIVLVLFVRRNKVHETVKGVYGAQGTNVRKDVEKRSSTWHDQACSKK